MIRQSGYGDRWNTACHDPTGISEALGLGGLFAGLFGDAAGAAVGTGLVGGVEGAGLGAAEAGITGGNPLTGALTGGLTGGALGGLGGAGGLIDSATGLGAVGSDALIGAGSGALGAGITGGDPLAGTLEGAVSGGISGELGQVFNGSDVGTLPSTSNPFGGAASDASSAATYSPSEAPGITSSAPITASPLNLGAAAALGGPGTASFTPPTAGIGSVDLTSSFGGNPGGSVFTGATSSDAVPGGLPSTDPGGSSVQTSPAASTGPAPFDSGTFLYTDPSGVQTSLPGAPPAPPSGGDVNPVTGAVNPDTSGTAPGLLGRTWNSVSDAISPVTSPIGSAVNSVGTALNSPTGKVIGTGASLLGLGNSLISALNPNPIPGMAQVQQLANELGGTGAGLIGPAAASASSTAGQASAQAQTLENYLNTGTLPPAVQASLDAATANAITAIKAQYAARGMPPGSSSEIQDINAIQQNAVIQGGTLAASLYSQGVSQENLAAGIYENLVGSGTSLANADITAQTGLVSDRTALNTGLNSAIANLASSLGGGKILNGATLVTAQA